MHNIYFDNSATTAVLPSAAKIAYETMTENYGNPSSVHGAGVKASEVLSSARSVLLSSFGIKGRGEYSVFFAGSGTEADNMAISGTLFSKNFRFSGPPRIITTDSEHPAVLNPIAEAEKKGFEVIRLKTVHGVIDMAELENALSKNTVLVSVMLVNNETGAVYDVKRIFSKVKEKCPDAVTHCDAIQAYMKIPCDIKLGCDLISVSGHKIGAPKGIGALLCHNSLITKKRITPVIFGGGQEGGLRSGTENMPAIAAFAEAVRVKSASVKEDYERVRALREYLISHLPDGTAVNTPSGEYLPHIISIRYDGIKSEVLVRALSSCGIYISAGSACSSKKLKTSTALTAFGHTPNEADSTVRVSISALNTEDECRIFCTELGDILTRLARKR